MSFNIRVISKTAQGRRPYQEDRVCDAPINDKYRLVGVFDGHGGAQVAEFCKDNFPVVLSQVLMHTHEKDVALRWSFYTMDMLVEKLNMPHVGSTAVVALLTPSSVWFANAGDSMAMVVYKSGKAELVSVEHKVENKEEQERMVKNGGTITYDDGCARIERTLNVSRSIGDYHMKRHVISIPFIRSVSRVFDTIDYCLLASDGVWDVFNTQGLANIVSSSRDNIDAALDSIIELSTTHGADNATITYIDWKGV